MYIDQDRIDDLTTSVIMILLRNGRRVTDNKDLSPKDLDLEIKMSIMESSWW